MWSSFGRRDLSIIYGWVSSNFTVWLNEAGFIVKHCFVVKTDHPDSERGITDYWDKITYKKLFPYEIVRKSGAHCIENINELCNLGLFYREQTHIEVHLLMHKKVLFNYKYIFIQDYGVLFWCIGIALCSRYFKFFTFYY